jgi:AraC family transcriptional regulator of adaptative response / DNA-3-methyladenine glycosylase II
MLDRTFARDASFDRRFIVGVRTTKIYCVASCRANKPKPENIEFYSTPLEAGQAGLRACKRCLPDENFAGIDVDELLFERLVKEVRDKPQQFEGIDALSRWAGVSPTKLNTGLRTYYQTTPGTLLGEARIEMAAKLLLTTSEPATAIGADVGFASTSAFYEQFARTTGVTPASYRNLRSADEFEICLPSPYPERHLVGYLTRDAQDASMQFTGQSFVLALPELVRFEIGDGRVRVRPELPGSAAKTHRVLTRMFGMNQNPAALDATIAERFPDLAGAGEGLRVFQTPDVFDSIVWSIVGQQMTVKFAMVLRRRLFELVGQKKVGGVYAPLRPEQLAELSIEKLVALQYSRRKAEYVVGAAQRFLEQGIDPEALPTWPATRVERWLLEMRGFGPWSTNYAMLRGCGFPDCVPLGDTGLTSGLQSLYGLEVRPNPEQTLKLMEVFRPNRSLATFRIWYSRRLGGEAETVA